MNKRLICFVVILLILISFSFGCIKNEDKNGEHSDIKKIEILYQIKIDYNGNDTYLIQIPLFIDEDEQILEINNNFKIKYGEIISNYNYTKHGPALSYISNKSFFIEINESYKNINEITNNTIELSMSKLIDKEYWVYSNLNNSHSINLSLFMRLRSIKDNGSIKGERLMIFNGNLNYDWNIIKVEGGSITE